MHKRTNGILCGLLSILLMVAIGGGAAAAFYKLRNLSNQNARLASRLSDLDARMGAWQKSNWMRIEESERKQALISGQLQHAQNGIGALASQTQDLSESIRKTREDIETNRSRLSDLSGVSSEQISALHTLSVKLGYAMKILAQQYDESLLTGKDANKPRPFSYYAGTEWHAKIEDFRNGIPPDAYRQLYVSGDGNADTFKDSVGKQDFIIDGIFFSGIEIYDTANGATDTITVTEPGLADLGKRTLEIKGDSTVDTVVLDGCLKWKEDGSQGDFDLWNAIDVNGEKKTVKISRGVSVQAEKVCDNEYVQRKKRKIVSAISRYIVGAAQLLK